MNKSSTKEWIIKKNDKYCNVMRFILNLDLNEI